MVIAKILQKFARYSPSNLPIKRSRPAVRADKEDTRQDIVEYDELTQELHEYYI